MVMFRPRAKHDHDYPVGDADGPSAAQSAAAAAPYLSTSSSTFDAWAKQGKGPASSEGVEFL